MRIDGLASGLQTTDIITQLMAVESKPLTTMKNDQRLIELRKQLMSEIKSSLFSLQSAAGDLTFSSAFRARTVTTSDDSVATASASAYAANSAFSLTNIKLAKAAMATSQAPLAALTGATATTLQGATMSASGSARLDVAFNNLDGTNASATPPYGTNLLGSVKAGSFTINGVSIQVQASDNVTSVISKINEAGAGVTATIANNKITLTQKTIGSTAKIEFGATDTSGFLAAVGLAGQTAVQGSEAKEKEILSSSLGVSSGVFTINGISFTVGADDTLNSVIGKINNSSAVGVSAFYDSNSKTVMFTSRGTGSSANFTMGDSNDTSDFLEKVGLLTNKNTPVNSSTLTTAAKDAEYDFNGVHMTSPSNSFSVNGINVTLKSSGDVNFVVKSDVDAMYNKIKGFVDTYNSTLELINTRLSETKAKEVLSDADRKQGLLRGDSLLRDAQNILDEFSFTTVKGISADMNSLYQIGISTGAIGTSLDAIKSGGGKISIDAEKLKKALTERPDDVMRLFTRGSSTATDEAVATGDGTTKVFNLANKFVSGAPAPIIKVDGEIYTYSANPSSDVTKKEYSIDFSTGKITFGAAIANNAKVTATYDYTLTTSDETGLAVRLKNQLADFTRVGGSIDSRLGSSGSYAREARDIKQRIADYEDRLKLREDSLWRQFNAMETALSKMKNQGNWMSSQLASLPSWSS